MAENKKIEHDPAGHDPAAHKRLVDKFMNATDHLQQVFGPADHIGEGTPVIHRHDDFEHASEDDLAQFDVETDSEGHHYGVRKPHIA